MQEKVKIYAKATVGTGVNVRASRIFFVVLLMLTGGLASCDKTNPEDPIEYPVDIPLTEYNLSARSGVSHDSITSLIIINSTEEMQAYGLNGPVIDFSAHTLLVLSGDALDRTPYGVRVNHVRNSSKLIPDFRQDTTNEFTFDAVVATGTTPISEQWGQRNNTRWVRAYLVPKLPQKANITLNFRYESFYDDINTMQTHLHSSDIIGKWKLVTFLSFDRGGWGISDHSENNIVYEFKPDGVLTVSGNIEHPHFRMPPKTEDYFYSTDTILPSVYYPTKPFDIWLYIQDARHNFVGRHRLFLSSRDLITFYGSSSDHYHMFVKIN